MKTGARIKELRQKLGLSVDDLAKMIGKNRATIYRYESNEIENFPISVLIPLAKALKTSPCYLLEGDKLTNSNNILNNNEISNSSVNFTYKSSDTVDENIDELVRIYRILNVKQKNKLLSYAFELEEKQKEDTTIAESK